MREIHIYKFKKKLQIHSDQNNNVKNDFRIGIGEQPVGNKKLRDDLRTPEGEYKVCVKNNKSKFYLSLGLNYPNIKDAELALNERRINQQEYESIIKAQNTHGGSDWSTAIGGAIYIHGGLEDKEQSEGCIRMLKNDIEFIFDYLSVGDIVKIFP